MTQKHFRNTWNTLLLLLLLWSGVVRAMEVADLHRSRENRKESRELQDIGDACSHTCDGKKFGVGTGTCAGNMTLNCRRRLYPYKGVELNTSVVLTCRDTFENTSTRSTDGIQTHLQCVDMIYMKSIVHTLIPEKGEQNMFIFEYTCSGPFSLVTNDDTQKEGAMGSESFQNSVCNGTEIVQMQYSSQGDLGKKMFDTGGSFLQVNMGSCSESAELLKTIDVLGVLYSYMVVPTCEPEKSTTTTTHLYSTEIVPITLSCNGETQMFNQTCKGLLLSMTEISSGAVTCKCSGHWSEEWSEDHAKKKYVCAGNLSGEQVRAGKAGKYVRTSFCGGKNTFVPLYWKDEEGKEWSGSWNNCTETGVRSTMFTPYLSWQL